VLTNRLTRLRSAISLMVLLAVCISLLPAQRVSAQLTIPLTRGETTQVFLEWYTEHVNTGSKGVSVERLIVGRLLNNVTLPTPEMTTQLEAMNARYYKLLGARGADPAYRKSLPASTLARAMYDAAIQTPAFKDEVVTVYHELKHRVLDLTDLDFDGYTPQQRAVWQAVAEEGALSNAFNTLFGDTIDQALVRARTEPQFAKVWDKYFAPDGHLSIATFDAKTFLAAYPDTPIPQQVRDAVRPDGSMEISLADLEKLAKDEFGKINASIDDMQKTLVTLSAQQGELVDFMRDQQKRQAAQALAEAKAKEHQLRLEAASSTVSIVSTLVGLKYPERGRQIAVVGGSLIKVGDSLTGYVKTVAGMSALSASLSSVVLTGNVLGAVMNIVSLFGPQQPTPEQLILEEIGKLRQQVNELRTEMHTRFDQIDKELNAIYTSMHDRFNQIDLKLGKLTTSLAEIQQSLLTLAMTLNRMERNNFEYLDALGRRPLREAINGALGYQERTGLEMPYQPEFVNYENIFHSWGTINAFDALSAGPTERDYSDGQMLAELSAAPLDANLNYLNGWLQAHGMQPFATKRLPSPRDWAFASRAYAELGFEWPAHLKRIGGQRQAALDAVGNDLEQALQNISTIQTPNGPQGNAPLWNGLTDYYNAKLQGLDNALIASEAAYAGELQATLKRTVPLDLYGGLDQTLPYPYRPDDFTTITCGGQGVPESRLAAPQHLKNLIASYHRFALADYLRVSPLKVCVNAGWVNLDPPCVAGPGTCNRYGEIMVVLVVVADNTASLVRHPVVGPRRLHSDANIWSIIAPEWTTYWKRSFELNFQGRTPTPLSPEAARALESVSSATASKLAELQRAYANRLLGELTRGPVQASAVELAGAKKLLESFIILGLPQAVSNDDLMRSLLFSNEALIDDQKIASFYAPPAPSTTEAPSEAQLLDNPRVRLLQTGQKRREALSGLLTDYLGSISTENHLEDNALVAGSRFDLQLARTFADPNAPLPGQSQVVFLPLLRR
jgi:hypothetical protein